MIICFDLDGTLVNTEKWIINALKESYQKHGKKFPPRKKLFKYWGRTATYFIHKISPELTKKEVMDIRNDFYTLREKTKSMIKPFPNSKKVLRNLSKKYTLVIVSNNPHKRVLDILKTTKIDKKLFKMIIGDDEVKRAKPFPDEIHKAEKKFKKQVKFMVGDTIQDIKTAKAAKVKSIIIKNGPKETWKDLKKADFIIKDIKELPKLLKEAE